MDVVIVFKPDGTTQCETSDPIPLEHHSAELLKIGASEIVAEGNVPGPNLVMTMCGLPTGRVNAFMLLRKDWEVICAGFVGTLGFRLWTGAPYPELGQGAGCTIRAEGLVGTFGASVGTLPVLIRELMGRPCRCYLQGDPLSDDYIPVRVNVERDEDGQISDIWFG